MKDYFDPGAIRGLTEKEAAEKLKEEGYNELPSAKRRSILAIALEVVKEPMFILLVAGGVLYMILGDLQEALMLLGFVFVVMGITLYQERKTERALEALRDLSSPRALVIRDGAQRRIPGREVVSGDIVVLAEGDRVPADGVLLSCLNLSVDESLLTGESVPVRKAVWDRVAEMGRPGGDDLPSVYSGTLVVQGQGLVLVRATGFRTEIGKIGKALQSLEPEDTLLQKETGRLVKNLALVGGALCVLAILAYWLIRKDLIHGVLAGITLAMAILPEEFPVVLTIFLALGAWRISQKRVLTRRIPAIETLGSATVLCVDKTGTLTLNRMAVGRLCDGSEFYDVGLHRQELLPAAYHESLADSSPHLHGTLPDSFHELLEFAILASQSDPFDPMEKAIRQLGELTLARTEHLHANWTLEREYPLSKELLAMSHVWRSPDARDYVIAVKGAPEAVMDLCHLPPARCADLAEKINLMARDGLRVLGVAKAHFVPGDLPQDQHEFEFVFLGLVGLIDPVRPTVPQAVKECYTAGIRVVMITGDYPGTAMNIAKQIGLTPNDAVVTGPELDAMDDEALRERVKEVCLFARVVPEQKLRLVNALKANGEIVAMTGDGVNDAPALKAAHIGVAMGGRGTDVAREASALVLLDDDFSSIVQAVRLGRRIFHNIRKAVAYIFAIHVPIAGMSLLPVLLKWPLMLLPVHVVFLELIIDPACSVVFEAEPEEDDIMHRPPRNPKEPLFSRHTVALSILQGVGVLVITLAVYGISLLRGQGEAEARALTFTTLVVANLSLILTNRSWTRTILSTLKAPNTALWWVVGGTLGFLGLALYLPALRSVFQFSLLHSLDLIICFGAGVLGVLWFETLKVVSRRRDPNAKK